MAKADTHYKNFLIRGSDYIKQDFDFMLKGLDEKGLSESEIKEVRQEVESLTQSQTAGREEEVKRLAKALLRERANSILLIGPGGVGRSALCKGLQTLKDSEGAPVDLVTKRFYWLDTDGLFAQGNKKDIEANFKQAIKRLSAIEGSVLVIDDMRDFVDGCRENGCGNLINMLMREIKHGQFQAIFEANESDLGRVLDCHSDMKESYTHMDLKEPGEEALKLIVNQACIKSEVHHGVKISDEAKAEAIKLTSKFLVRDMGLSRAQPERTLTLIDRALTALRWKAHTSNPHLDELNARLASVVSKLENPDYSADNGGKTREELEIEREALETDIAEAGAAWEERREKIRKKYADIKLAEDRISQWEDEIDEIKANEEKARHAQIARNMELADEADAAGNGDGRYRRQAHLTDFADHLDEGGIESNEVSELRSKIEQYKEYRAKYKKEFDTLTEDLNEGLELTAAHVLSEFSAISGIPADKLSQNEKEKLRNLEANLGNRVWGQDEAVSKLAKAVKVAKAGLRERDKPEAAFLYLGPSGVGKTELAKALASELLDDERALLRFDMSEFQEKHALAKLIGAPPGYEGYEAGGILTNAMFRNPRRIILFDEIEKAHPDIFLILLQVLGDARLSDNKGRVASFSDAIIIMTSNTGRDHFTNPDLTFEQAKELALKNLEKGNGEDDKGLPPELLNRFNGRKNIVCFDQLNHDVIEKIAKRDLSKLNKQLQYNKPGLSISYEDGEIKQMCKDHYVPVEGARGIVGFIDSEVKPAIADTLLFDDAAQGVMRIEYDENKKEVVVHPAQPEAAAPENAQVARPSEEFGAQQPG